MSPADHELSDEALLSLMERLLVDGGGLFWHEVCGDLLRLCRRFGPEWHGMGSDPEVLDAICGVDAEAQAVLAADGGMIAIASVDELTALRSFVRDQVDALNGFGGDAGALVANGLARAIDAMLERSGLLPGYFRNRHPWRIGTGTIYPVLERNPIRALGGVGGHKPNTQPANLPDARLDHTRHLGLGAADGLPVILDFSLWSHLAGLDDGPTRIGTVQPNLSLAEFDVWREPQADPSGTSTSPRRRPAFGNRGPRDPAVQHRLLVGLVEGAVRLGARVVVTGEYACSVDRLDSLRDALAQLDRCPQLVVVGTADPASRPDRPEPNEAALLVPQAGIVKVAKRFAAADHGAVESIRSAGELRVFVTQFWTLAVLICRDAMSTAVDVLGRLGVNLLLVPTMTDRAGSLIDRAMQLRTAAQAFVTVAVSPASYTPDPVEPGELLGDRPQAAFGGPYEHYPHILTVPIGTAPARRTAWVFDSAAKTVTEVAGTSGQSI